MVESDQCRWERETEIAQRSGIEPGCDWHRVLFYVTQSTGLRLPVQIHTCKKLRLIALFLYNAHDTFD